jgi:Holliday junction resolvasome RuvABC endonuclease subunit
MRVKIIGLDNALTNTGIAPMFYDTDTGKLEVADLKLVETSNEKGKLVRQNSDDLRRAREISKAMNDACAGALFAVAEVPTGAQSARAALAFGMVIGMLANIPVPLIQVSPTEVKMAVVGHRQASKEEMIEWAMNTYPAAPWLTMKRGGVRVPVAKNEHLADACAVVHAGILTDEFRNALRFLQVKAA